MFGIGASSSVLDLWSRPFCNTAKTPVGVSWPARRVERVETAILTPLRKTWTSCASSETITATGT